MRAVCVSSPRKAKVPTVVAPPSASCTLSARHAVASSALLGGGRQEGIAARERIGKGHVDGRLRCLGRLVLRIGGVRRRRGGGAGVVVRVVDERAVLRPLRRALWLSRVHDASTGRWSEAVGVARTCGLGQRRRACCIAGSGRSAVGGRGRGLAAVVWWRRGELRGVRDSRRAHGLGGALQGR